MKQDNSALIVVGIFVGYILAFILTFGHAYKSIPDTEERKYGDHVITLHNGAGVKATGAFLSSMFWPLYWSVRIWE